MALASVGNARTNVIVRIMKNMIGLDRRLLSLVKSLKVWRIDQRDGPSSMKTVQKVW